MDAQKWRNVKYVFSSALEQPAGALGAFLDRACGDDVELRAEVNRLLVEHLNAGEFLEEPLNVRPRPLGAQNARGDAVPEQHLLHNGRFEIRGRLGAGGFGDVYEAFDRKRNALVALKYLRRFEPEQLYRLKREFRTLTEIRHPNLIHVHELFSSADPPFFTMELLKGRDLRDFIRETADRSAAEHETFYTQLRGFMLQLARGVTALHETRLVHRDIKPSNVFVTDAGRIVLLDFGLVKQLDATVSLSTLALAGTPHYLAPEQIDGGEPTPATDWYAVGIVLFEALTGRMPFEGSILQVLSRKRSEEPLRPSAWVAGVPGDLDVLCQRLLDHDASRRPTGPEVVRALEGTPAPISVVKPPSRGVASRVLFGRELQLTALQQAFDQAEQGATVCVHVRGASGVGKTGIVRAFLERLRDARPECIVLNGRCYESEAAPHKGLDELVDRLALFLKSLEPQRAQALLPRHFVLLTRIFPVLQQLSPASRTLPEIADPREQRHRAFACLRECLSRISESRPLILWIDDLQWCDSDTVRLLNGLVQSTDPFGCLVLLSYRDTDVDTHPVLAALDRGDRSSSGAVSVRTVMVENLSFDEARHLALALLREHADADGTAAADEIARESKGNPFFVTELVRYVVALPDRRDLTAGAFGIGHVIKRRVGLLPEPALRLLELVAVAGQPLASEVGLKAARIADEHLEIRSLLAREHLLRTTIQENGEELDVYHDQVREAITGYLSAEAAVVYHGLLAQALDQAGCADRERLSVHYDAAGNPEKAIRYALLAAGDAVEALAFDRAARLYRRVLELGGDALQSRVQVLEQLGDALSNAARGKDAAEAFLQASDRCDPVRRVDLRRRACEQYLRSGHLDEGIALVRSLLREVGVWYPERRSHVLLSLIWHRLRLRMTRRRMLEAQPSASATAADQMKLDVCWTCAVGMSMVDVLRGADFQTQYTLLALKSGEPSRVSLGLAAELAMGRMDGGRPRAETERLFASALRLANDSHDPRAVAFATSMKGVASWIEGDWADCWEKNDLAATLFRDKCSGVGWELTTAHTFALSALVFMGRWRELPRVLPVLIQQAEARGDRYGAVSLPLIAYTYVNSLAADRPDDAQAMIRKAIADWPYPDFQMQHCDALVGEVETYLYEGKVYAALDEIARNWKAVERSQLLHVQIYRVLMHGLRGRTSLAVAAADGSGRTRLLRATRQDASRLLRLRPRWAVAMGHALHAGAASLEDRREDAERHLRQAADLFAQTRMDHYLAAVRMRLHQLRPELTEERDRAARWMTDQAIVNPDRLAAVMVPGF